MKYKHTKEQLQLAVDNSLSIAEVCRQLGIRPVGGNYKTIHRKLAFYQISTEHFTGQVWNVGTRYRPIKKAQSLDLILVKDSTYCSSSGLKQRLFKEGVLEPKCQVCGLSSWMGKPVPTELDHINGVNTDHRIENLRILCPNCHAQTSNFRGKKKKLSSALSNKRALTYKQHKMPQ